VPQPGRKPRSGFDFCCGLCHHGLTNRGESAAENAIPPSGGWWRSDGDRGENVAVPHRIVTEDGGPARTPYSPAVLASGSRTLFISGQLAEGPDGELVGGDDVGAQAAQCFRNIDVLLRAAGAGPTDVTRIAVYLLDSGDRAAVARERNAYFGEHRPASTGLVVSELLVPGALVEVEAIAVF
jgi:2-iminobutanoate/2-iminopropanoate deaminase